MALSRADMLRKRVRDIVLEMAPFSSSAVSGSTTLKDDLGYDSLGLFELAAAIEQEFALPTISADDSHNVRTIADVEDIVARIYGTTHADSGSD